MSVSAMAVEAKSAMAMVMIRSNKYIHISFDEYKEYTDADYELMKEIDNRFDALKKNEISRTEKVDE